jgi:hypothetical protein
LQARSQEEYDLFRQAVAHLLMGLGGEDDKDTKERIAGHGPISDRDVIPIENMLVRITQQDVVYRRYLVPTHRSYVPDFGVYIRVQGTNGVIEYRSLSRQLVLFCVERRKAWRMLQSKAGIENREYKRSVRSLPTSTPAGSRGMSCSRTPRN